MNYPDKCPNCGAVQKVHQFHDDRKVYACESWIKTGLQKLTWKSDTCCDWRTIRESAAVIRAFLDGDRDAREMGFNWIAENAP